MAALAGRVAGDASAAARTVTTGEYAAGAGRAQRVLSKPAAVSPTYHAAARCRTRGSHPPPGFGWSFPVTEFALYSSSFARGRTRYTQLQRWTLTE